MKNSVIVSKEEFKKIIAALEKSEEVRILANSDPNYLTDQELEQLKIAEEEFKNRESISFEDVKGKWLKGKRVNV
jgi:hypothetical protein